MVLQNVHAECLPRVFCCYGTVSSVTCCKLFRYGCHSSSNFYIPYSVPTGIFAVDNCHVRNQDWKGEFDFQPRMHLEFGVKEQVVSIGNVTINCECWSKLITTGQEYTEEPRASKPIASFVAVIHCFITLKFPCLCVIIVTCSCCKRTTSFIISLNFIRLLRVVITPSVTNV